MNQGLIPGRYAKALFSLAADKGMDSRVYELAKNLEASFASEPALRQAVANPFVSVADKTRLLTTAADAKPSDDIFADFIKLLAQNNRIAIIREIAIAYMRLYRDHHNIRLVTVRSAAPMQPGHEKRVNELIASHLQDASMEYHSETDAELIGGFTVAIDNEKLDASVANELKQLRLKLFN